MQRALTIAGSDSGGGAGIQADLKTFHALGVYGASALTLVTAQNTLGVDDVHLLPSAVVRSQMLAVLDDIGCDAAKTGAIGSAELIATVARTLRERPIEKLVVDPVMISKHGAPLLSPDAVVALRSELLPLAFLVTPNRHEAEVLSGVRLDSLATMEEAARRIVSFGPRAVLVKGGALGGDEAVDLLVSDGHATVLRVPRIETRSTHGTGCTCSAAITALLARGGSLEDAVRGAKAYVTRAIETAPAIGRGFGPVNHAVE